VESIAGDTSIHRLLSVLGNGPTGVDVDALKLISMCLVHDLPEARIGDLNSVHKAYVEPDEPRAVADMVRALPFAGSDSRP